METEQPTLHVAWLWAARAVACSFLILGALVFSGFRLTGSLRDLTIAFLGIGGALVFAYGIERPHHPAARAARWVGWGMLLAIAFVLFGGSLMFPPLLLALLGLPALVRAPPSRTG